MSYGKRDYRGEIVPLATAQRRESYTRAGVDLTYTPVRWAELKAGYSIENRNANDDRFDYKDRIAFLSLTARY